MSTPSAVRQGVVPHYNRVAGWTTRPERRSSLRFAALHGGAKDTGALGVIGEAPGRRPGERIPCRPLLSQGSGEARVARFIRPPTASTAMSRTSAASATIIKRRLVIHRP